MHLLLVAYAHAQCAKAHSKRWLAAARGHSGPSDVKVLSALCAVAGLDCLITKNLRQTLPLWALLVTSDLNLGCTCHAVTKKKKNLVSKGKWRFTFLLSSLRHLKMTL